MNSILRKVEELGLNALAGNTWKSQNAPGTKLNSGKKKKGLSGGIIPKGEPHERNPCAPGFEEQPPEETSRQADRDSKVAWNLAIKCTMLSKRDLSSDEKGYFAEKVQKPDNGTEPWPGKVQMNENAQVFVHDFDLFVTVRLLDEMPAVLLLHLLCSKNTGIHLSGKIGETPQLATNWKSITGMMDNFELLVESGLSSIPAAVCLQHRDQQISKIMSENWDYYQIRPRLEVPSMHAGNRCWQILISRPRETMDQHIYIYIFNDEVYKEDPTQGIPDWLQPFTVNLEDLEYMCSHISLKEWIEIRKVMLPKWRHQNGSTVFIPTSTKVPKEIYCTNRRDWWHENQWILPVFKQNFTGDGEEIYGSFQIWMI